MDDPFDPTDWAATGSGLGDDVAADLDEMLDTFAAERIAPVVRLIAEKGGDPADSVAAVAGRIRRWADDLERDFQQGAG